MKDVIKRARLIYNPTSGQENYQKEYCGSAGRFRGRRL